MIVTVRDREGTPRHIAAVPVDKVGAEERAAFFGKRSVKARASSICCTWRCA